MSEEESKSSPTLSRSVSPVGPDKTALDEEVPCVGPDTSVLFINQQA